MERSPGKSQDWTWLQQRLAGGQESTREVADFLNAGGQPNDLVVSTFGNREVMARPCPRSLDVLLKAKADPNHVDTRLGSPFLHIAAWMGTPEIVTLLLEHRADIEMGEQGSPTTPPLNTALAGGNAPVVLLLLRRHANAQWRHKDGASALHVAAAWLSDSRGGNKPSRKPPIGDEPQEVISTLLRYGADPSLREGMQGLTPLDAFREGVQRSPWMRDEKTADGFKRSSDRILAMLAAGDVAMKHKLRGNKAFSEGRNEDAPGGIAAARCDGKGTSSEEGGAVLEHNEMVRVDEVQGAWARVSTASGASGWVRTTYLRHAPVPAGPPPTSSRATSRASSASTTHRRRVTFDEEEVESVSP